MCNAQKNQLIYTEFNTQLEAKASFKYVHNNYNSYQAKKIKGKNIRRKFFLPCLNQNIYTQITIQHIEKSFNFIMK